MGWFFSDYRVSPNFLLCWGWVVVEVVMGCDNINHIYVSILCVFTIFSVIELSLKYQSLNRNII